MNVWIIAPGENAAIWNDCKDNGYIAIGWNQINMRHYKTKDDLNKDIEKRDGQVSLWYFGKEIKIGDIVIARNGLSTVVGVGKVLSDYISPEDLDNPRINKDYKQVRKIKWISVDEYKLETGQFTRAFTIVKTDENDFKIKTYLKDILMKEKLNDKINLLKYQKQIILQGPPGTGKTRLAKRIAISMIDNLLPRDTNDDIKSSLKQIGNDRVKLIQFHPSYSYEDFVRGIVATPTDDGKGVKYETQNKILADMAEKALTDKEKKPYILIIDEINRANLSSVLGELIYALEYRDEAVESMYEFKGSREIVLPSNLYIIGTMNTADRSVGHIDYAIRRRFAFETIKPDGSVVNTKSKFKEVEAFFKGDNKDDRRADSLSPEFDPDDVMLGHSYFMADTDEDLENKLKYQVKPLLMEYIKDGVLIESKELKEKIKNL